MGPDKILAVKAALRLEQVQDLDIPSSEGLEPKRDSKQIKRWREEYGRDQNTFELEALDDAKLIELVKNDLLPWIDKPLYERQVSNERKDARELEGVREAMRQTLASYLNGRNGRK